MSESRTRIDPALLEKLRALGLDEDTAAAAYELVREALGGPLDRRDTPSPDERPAEPPSGRTLADGRPGHRHPISEADARRPQAGSVADQTAHADSKLSSSRGISTERHGESLADGHPGSDNPISKAKPR